MMKRKLEGQLLEQLSRVTALTTGHVDAVLQDLMECSLPQFLVLETLAAFPVDQGALAVTDIARALGCSKANAGQLVSRLEEMRRVKKLSSGADARVTALRLTPQGEEDYERGANQLTIEAKQCFAELTTAEKQQLLALLTKVSFPP